MGFDAVHVGLDIGQQRDPSAVVVAQVMTDHALPTRYITQHMERLPLGTSYPDQAAYLVKLLAGIAKMLRMQRDARLAELVAQVQTTGQQLDVGRAGVPTPDVRVFLDVTGVGRPVYDILERAVASDERTRGVDVRPITFTHGDTYDAKTGRMGKAYLVSRLQALLQGRCLTLPPLHPDTEQMARELKDYEIHVSAADAHDTYGAFKVGTHDDLVTALGLAVLEDPARSGIRLRFFE